ncbi:MAG: hypothetical protein QXR53_01425 [Candidatus Norongarragalinales archaeon]
MARFVAQETPLEQLERLVPNILILLILILALLVVLTKFGWVHCTQVPFFNWCDTYCTYVEQGKSRVGVLYGSDGMGDPQALRALLGRQRGFTLVEPLEGTELSAGVLKKYDLLVVEKFKTASTRQVDAIIGYLDSGGTVVWVGDSFSNQYADEFDLLLARQKNESFHAQLLEFNVTNGSQAWNEAWNAAKTQSWYKLLYNKTKFKGFDVLEDYLRARYNGTVATDNASFRVVDPSHMLVKGLYKQYPLSGVKEFARVFPDASGVNMLAQIVTPKGVYPAVLETRYSGKIVYIAFPLEQVDSTTFLVNLLDYLVSC